MGAVLQGQGEAAVLVPRNPLPVNEDQASEQQVAVTSAWPLRRDGDRIRRVGAVAAAGLAVVPPVAAGPGGARRRPGMPSQRRDPRMTACLAGSGEKRV